MPTYPPSTDFTTLLSALYLFIQQITDYNS